MSPGTSLVPATRVPVLRWKREPPTPHRPRPPGAGGSSRPSGAPETNWPRWVPWLVAVLVVSALLLGNFGRSSSKQSLSYSDFLNQVKSDQVERVKIDQVTGKIDGVLKNGKQFHANGPQNQIPDKDIQLLSDHNVARDYKPRSSDFLGSLLVWVLPFGIIIALWWWMGRRAQGQMAGIMSIGRSRAKVYTTEQPKTTFADVAGYAGVKQEISEVVDFLQDAGQVQGDRRPHPQGRAAGRPSRHRQDADRPGRGRRGRRAVHVGHRLRLHGDVRGRRRQPGPRPVPDGPQAGAGHHLRRRDRLHRPQARRRPRRRPRRARADAQPDALGDGRLRDHRGHRDDGGHQPARHPRPGAAAPRSLRPPDRRAAARPRGAAGHPAGALQGQAHRRPTSTSTSWPGARRA